MTFNLTAMRKAKEGATEGPWAVCGDGFRIKPVNKSNYLCPLFNVNNVIEWDAENRAWRDPDEEQKKDNAALIAMAPEMADEIERLTSAHAAARADALREAAQQAEAEASAKNKDKVKGMHTVHKYNIADHRAALHWIAKNDKDAIARFIEVYVAKNHKGGAIDGVDTWTEKEAF